MADIEDCKDGRTGMRYKNPVPSIDEPKAREECDWWNE